MCQKLAYIFALDEEKKITLCHQKIRVVNNCAGQLYSTQKTQMLFVILGIQKTKNKNNGLTLEYFLSMF